MSRDDVVTIEEIEVGAESASAEAIRVKIDDEWKWIPLSVVRTIHRDPKVRGQDSVEIERWFAEKEGLA